MQYSSGGRHRAYVIMGAVRMIRGGSPSMSRLDEQ